MEKVSPCPITGCWWWTASSDKDGYGSFVIDCRTGTSGRAHRASWELFRGSSPGPLDVLHRCDNPACVNPNHLFLGTHGDNNRDCAAKGRTARGARHPRWKGGYQRPKGPGLARGERDGVAKLTESAVREIRARWTAGRPCAGPKRQPNSAGALAREFGVRKATIARVVKRITWAHVS